MRSNFLFGLVALSVACGSGGDGAGGAGGAAGAGGAGGGGGAGALPGWQLGPEGAPPGFVPLTSVYEPNVPVNGTDLDFNPVRPGELWVVTRPFYEGLPCTSAVKQGCTSLEGRVVIVTNAPGPDPTHQIKKDPNAWHFMRRPTSIAFGPGDTFATCHEARTGNFEDSLVDYIGPTLWSSDPDIFTKELPPPPGENFVTNGSHLDMLHATPFCMGIEHEKDNVYWCFNGQIGALDKYDFKEPHPPGGDDHSDGELYRFVEGQLSRVENVPSHLALDRGTGLLYIADTGNQRIAVLDTNSGTLGEDIVVQDAFFVKKRVDGAVLTTLIPPGTLQQPSGIAVHQGVLFVGDAATGRLHAFDLAGAPLRTLETGLPPGALAGIAIGPDQKLYYVDATSSAVRRVDPPAE